MNRHILVLLLVSSSILGHAQHKPFKLGVSTFTNVSFNFITASDGQDELAGILRDWEQPKVGFGINVFGGFWLAKQTELTVGIGYLNFGEQSMTFGGNFTFPEAIDPFYGFVKPGSSSVDATRKYIYNYHNVEIPVQLRYHFKGGVYIAGGLSGLIQISQTITFWSKEDGETFATRRIEDQDEDFKTMNMAINAGAGYTFFRTRSTRLQVGLNTQYTLFGVADNTPVNRRYLISGIVVAVVF